MAFIQKTIFSLFLGFIVCLGVIPASYCKAPVNTQATAPQLDVMNPAALVDQFIGFVQYTPPSPFLLDLQGLEAKRQITGPGILSPNKAWLAATQVTFLPKSFETTTQVLITPIGALPKLDQYIFPVPFANYNAMQFNKKKRSKAKLTIADVDPKPFWSMYQVDQHPQTQQIVLRAGYDIPKPNQIRIYQVFDWSQDGQSLLLTYREGIYHSGIYRTVPVLRNLSTGETTYYRFLPKMLTDNYCQGGCSNAMLNDTMWDLRLLGWQTGQPNSMLIALVGFETGHEQPLAFYAYDTLTGKLNRLGDSLSPATLVSYGWQVQLKGPEVDSKTGQANYKRPFKTYVPTETPEAPATPRKKIKQYWQN